MECKRGKRKPTDCDSVQLCAQAICLEEMLGVSVPVGAIFTGNRGAASMWTLPSHYVVVPSSWPQPCTACITRMRRRRRCRENTAIAAR